MNLEFDKQLNQLLEVSKEQTLLMTDNRYKELLKETKEAIERRSCGMQISGLQEFEIITVDGSDKLTQRNANEQNSDRVLLLCMASEMFDVIHSTHLKIGHKNEIEMENELKKTYCNITRDVITIYLKLCKTCALTYNYDENASISSATMTNDSPEVSCEVPCLNCHNAVPMTEVSCFKCNGPLHLFCALATNTSGNIFCILCSDKTVEDFENKQGQKRKLNAAKDFEQLQKMCSSLDECYDSLLNLELSEDDDDVNQSVQQDRLIDQLENLSIYFTSKPDTATKYSKPNN